MHNIKHENEDVWIIGAPVSTPSPVAPAAPFELAALSFEQLTIIFELFNANALKSLDFLGQFH